MKNKIGSIFFLLRDHKCTEVEPLIQLDNWKKLEDPEADACRPAGNFSRLTHLHGEDSDVVPADFLSVQWTHRHQWPGRQFDVEEFVWVAGLLDGVPKDVRWNMWTSVWFAGQLFGLITPEIGASLGGTSFLLMGGGKPSLLTLLKRTSYFRVAEVDGAIYSKYVWPALGFIFTV